MKHKIFIILSLQKKFADPFFKNRNKAKVDLS